MPGPGPPLSETGGRRRLRRHDKAARGSRIGRGEHRLRLRFPRLPLLSGEYLWSVYVLDDTGLQVLDMAECIHPFRILNRNGREFGLVRLPHEWELVA